MRRLIVCVGLIWLAFAAACGNTGGESGRSPAQPAERAGAAGQNATAATPQATPDVRPPASPTPAPTEPAATPAATPAPATPVPVPISAPTPMVARPPDPGDCSDVAAAARLRPSTVRIQTSTSTGTGMVIRADGYILTADHVVEGARTALVSLAGGRAEIGTVIGRRVDKDLAVLKIAGNGYTPVQWGEDQALRPGERLLALGFARGIAGEPTLTAGTYSARRRGGPTRLNADMVQTDVPLNPGNSGGPLFTPCGAVVGVVQSRLPDSSGLNFAVAASDAQPFSVEVVTGAPPVAAAPPTASAARTATAAALTPTASRGRVDGRWIVIGGADAEPCANVRFTPGLSGVIVDCVWPGTGLILIEGPMPADGYLWWYTNAGGYVASSNFGPPSVPNAPALPAAAVPAEIAGLIRGYLNQASWAAGRTYGGDCGAAVRGRDDEKLCSLVTPASDNMALVFVGPLGGNEGRMLTFTRARTWIVASDLPFTTPVRRYP